MTESTRAGLLLMWTTGCAFTWPLSEAVVEDTGEPTVVVNPDGTTDGTTEPDVEPNPCNTIGLPALPAEDSVDAYYRDPVRMRLSTEDPTASLYVLATDGSTVEGTTAPNPHDPRLLEFTPVAPLEAGATYRAYGTYCDHDGYINWTFTVGPAGAPLDCDPTDVAYTVDLARARWMVPEAIGGLIPLVSPGELRVGVTAFDDARVSSHTTVAIDGTQDFCTPTTAMPDAERSGPEVSWTASSMALVHRDQVVELTDWYVDATLLPDCSGFAGGRSRGTIDLRSVTAYFDIGSEETTPDLLCRFMETYGTACEACPDGEPYCLAFVVEGIEGTAVEAPITCVDATDCHPACTASTCEDPAIGECDPT